MTEQEELDFLARFNTTELYQVAHRARLNPAPNASRETLIDLLRGAIEPPTQHSEADELRYGLAAFVDQHWAVLRSMISCPAKDHHPHTCFVCPDTQTLACLIDNPAADQFVQLRLRNHRS